MDQFQIKLEASIAEILPIINYNSELYYNEGEPEITDAEFDAYIEELTELIESLEASYPNSVVIADAKTTLNNVGAMPTYGKKVTHSQVMGSLSKVKTISGVREWYDQFAPKGGCKVVVGPKVDGCAGKNVHKNGLLVESATRGNGIVGMDITDNVREIKSIPKLIFNLNAEVRGELIMRRSSFNALINSGTVNFANPRNAGTGSVMTQDPKVTGQRNLDMLAYDVINDLIFTTEEQKLDWMRINLKGYTVIEYKVIDIEDFEALALEWEERRPTLDYEIDGLVISLNSIAAQEDAGWKGKRPNGKLAFKFKPEQAETVVLDIDLQVGRTGKLVPMARVTPTEVDGSTISNITLHNYANVFGKDVAIGDTILIEKAGDIIPQVVRVTSDQTIRPRHRFNMICPSCGLPIVVDAGGTNLWCENPACPAQLQRAILHWVRSLGIKGVGIGIIRKLCDKGYVTRIPDLYCLTPYQLQNVTGGSRAAEKVEKALASKMTVPLAAFLDGLGIGGLGTTTSKNMAKEFETLDAVLSVGYDDLIHLPDIGDTTAKRIVIGLSLLNNVIDDLRQSLTIEDMTAIVGPLTGFSFVLTGSMSKNRKLIAEDIEKAGGECKGSVGRGLSYLVQADPTQESGKTKKAKKYGTQIISEVELYNLMEK